MVKKKKNPCFTVALQFSEATLFVLRDQEHWEENTWVWCIIPYHTLISFPCTMCVLHSHSQIHSLENVQTRFSLQNSTKLEKYTKKVKYNKNKCIKQFSYLKSLQFFLAPHFITVDFRVHMLAFSSSWQWGCGEVEGRTRTSCYVKTNLDRGKRCLRPPLKVLQVVRDSDILKQRVMEAIFVASCERSSTIPSFCLMASEERSKTNAYCQQLWGKKSKY